MFKRLLLTILLALALVRTVLTVGLAAGGLAFGAFLAVTTARSLGVLLIVMLGFLLIAGFCVFLFAASLSVIFLAASLFLLAAFFLVLVTLMVLGAGGCCSAHHGHDHHGT